MQGKLGMGNAGKQIVAEVKEGCTIARIVCSWKIKGNYRKPIELFQNIYTLRNWQVPSAITYLYSLQIIHLLSSRNCGHVNLKPATALASG